MKQEFKPENILKIALDSWQPMFDVEESEFTLISSDQRTACGFSFLTGAISITRDKEQLSVVIDCSYPFIYAILRKCLDIKAQQATEEDMFDMVAELSNLFGGMLQHQLGNEYQIGLPSIAKGRAGVPEHLTDELISITNIQVIKYPVGIYIAKD